MNAEYIAECLSERKWRLVECPSSDAYFNMAADEYLMNYTRKTSTPCLRYYQWKPSGISIGYNQNVKQFLDVDFISSRGFQWVRRITGGETVFHHNDQTYAVTVPEGIISSPKTKSLYFFVHYLIGKAIETFGIRLDELQTRDSDARLKYFNCFAAKSDYELSWQGRKIAGSAQRRTKGVFLQHGAIMNAVDYEILDRIFLNGGNLPIKGVENLRKKLCGIKDILGEEIPERELKDAITKLFGSYGIEFVEKPFRSREIDEINSLKESLYCLHSWNREGRRKKSDGQ